VSATRRCRKSTVCGISCASCSARQFGRRSEKFDPEQLLLTLEDIEQAIASNEADDDRKDPVAARARAGKRRATRHAARYARRAGALHAPLPRMDVTIEPEDTNCPCCRAPIM